MVKVTRYEKPLINRPYDTKNVHVGDSVKLVPKNWGETVWVTVSSKSANGFSGKSSGYPDKTFTFKAKDVIHAEKPGMCTIM